MFCLPIEPLTGLELKMTKGSVTYRFIGLQYVVSLWSAVINTWCSQDVQPWDIEVASNGIYSISKLFSSTLSGNLAVAVYRIRTLTFWYEHISTKISSPGFLQIGNSQILYFFKTWFWKVLDQSFFQSFVQKLRCSPIYATCCSCSIMQQ